MAAARRTLTQSELADLRRTPCAMCLVFVVSHMKPWLLCCAGIFCKQTCVYTACLLACCWSACLVAAVD